MEGTQFKMLHLTRTFDIFDLVKDASFETTSKH